MFALYLTQLKVRLQFYYNWTLPGYVEGIKMVAG
jgi:hypothetical protein